MQTIRYRTGVNGIAWPSSRTRERQQTQRRCTIDKVRFCLSHLIYGTLSNHLYLIHAGNNYCEGVDGLAGAGKKRRRGQRYNTARTASVHLRQAIIFRRRSTSLTVTMGTMWSRTLLIHYLMWNVRWKWNFCNNCSRILSIVSTHSGTCCEYLGGCSLQRGGCYWPCDGYYVLDGYFDRSSGCSKPSTGVGTQITYSYLLGHF